MRRTLVVAGVIVRSGRVLIGQRRSTDRHPFKWEFPGGKIEDGESPADALRRELREELGIEAVIGPEVARYQHKYPNRPTFLLLFHRVESFSGEPRNLCFEQIVWELPGNLPSYDFLEGDVEFVRKLAEGRGPGEQVQPTSA